MNKTQTSIQISTKHRNILKKYCDKHGYNMSGFLEKLIESKVFSLTEEAKVRFTGATQPVKGATPLKIYEKEAEFCQDCLHAMDWASKRLGYPIVDIELTDVHFYAAFEEAVNLYNSFKRHEFSYSWIDDGGKDWIRRCFLALCKETLGAIRMKYRTIPVPGGEVRLDGEELKCEARIEKELLLRDL